MKTASKKRNGLLRLKAPGSGARYVGNVAVKCVGRPSLVMLQASEDKIEARVVAVAKKEPKHQCASCLFREPETKVCRISANCVNDPGRPRFLHVNPLFRE